MYDKLKIFQNPTNRKRLLFKLFIVFLFASCPDSKASDQNIVEQLETTTEDIKAVCVYCSASSQIKKTHLEVAKKFGEILAKRGIKLVYGGGFVGMMGALADGCLEKGGYVHGIIPKALQDRELGHKKIQKLEVVDTMHRRKAKMFELSDAIVVLPGGYGTLDETLEVLTWRQLSFHNKPLLILNNEKYWEPLRALLDHISKEGFATKKDRDLIQFVDKVGDILPAIRKEKARINSKKV